MRKWNEAAIWISLPGEDYPCINVLISNYLAYAHYFDSARQPGWQSLGTCDPSGTTLISDAEQIAVPNDTLIEMDICWKLVEEYMMTGARPKAILWREL